MAKKAPKAPKKAPKAAGNLSAAELARLCGMSLTRVYAELAQGRSAFEIIATAQRRKQQGAAREVSLLPVGLGLVGPAANGFPVNGGVPSYSESLARKEHTLAELRQVELMQKRKELMPVSYFRYWGLKFLTEARSLWTQGPSELADSLAATDDPRQCEAIVRGFCERVVGQLYQLESLWNPPGDDGDGDLKPAA